LNTNQNARIIKLEGETTILTKENISLKKRVKELEDENKNLRGVNNV
jgi:cell division protein FtsB